MHHTKFPSDKPSFCNYGPVLDSQAAFVDVGSEQMHVSIFGGPPKVFGTVTMQLQALRDWLLAQEVYSVVMEATGVYWLLPCDRPIQRTKAERVKESPRGTWAKEHLFALRQALQSGEHYQCQISECDRQVEQLLRDSGGSDAPPKPTITRKPDKNPGINAPKIQEMRDIPTQRCDGQDLTTLPAHTEYSALQIVSEVGTNLTDQVGHGEPLHLLDGVDAW